MFLNNNVGSYLEACKKYLKILIPKSIRDNLW